MIKATTWLTIYTFSANTVTRTLTPSEDLAFFSTWSFFPTTFVYIFSENAVHIGGFYFMQLQFMRLTSYERRMPDSLCLLLICCRMQGKRTDYSKVRIEVLNLFPGKNSAQKSWNPWVLPLFNIPNVMWWLLTFWMGNTKTNNNFFCKFKYNLLIETIWGRFFSLL